MLASASPAAARPGHGGSWDGTAPTPSGPCIYDSAGLPDGCDTAPTTGQFINTAFFTNARQSGQAQYKAAGGVNSDHPPLHNVAGVDFPVGAYTPDAALINPITSVPSGCSYVSTGPYIRCNSTSVLTGYFFNDVGLFQAGGGTTFYNNHVRVGINSCRAFTGGAPITQTSGSFDMPVYSNTFDLSDDCSFAAHLYKKANDPGLKTEATLNITIASNALTVNGSVTGTFGVGEYLDWSGIGTSQIKVSANVSPGSLKTCTGAACAGTSWTVCKVNLAAADACNLSSPDVTAVAATSGPLEPTLNIPVKRGNGTGADITAYYNAFLKYPAAFNDTGGGNDTIKWNYWEMVGCCGEHNNFIVFQPNPGSAKHVNLYQNYNTIVWDAISQPTGTAVLTTFTTSQAANTTAPAGYQITFDRSENNHNTIVLNTTTNNGAGPVTLTAAVWRYLSQGPTPTTGNITYTLSGGEIDVTSVNSGGPIAVGQYVGCSTCTTYTKITGFDTGSGGIGKYFVTNNVDTKGSTTGNIYLYPGIIGEYQAVGNYVDPVGSNSTYFLFDVSETPITTTTVSGNINMNSGNACTTSSCN